MRVGVGKAVTGEVFAAIAHAAERQAVHEALRQQGHGAGVAAKGAVADDGAVAVVQVEHGREAHVHAAGAQLGTQDITGGHGGVGGAQHRGAGHLTAALGLGPQRAQGRHRWQVGEAVGAKTLDTATLVVNRDQQVLAHGLDVAAQGRELLTPLPVATKQDHAPHQGMGQTLAVGIGQAQASHIDDQRGVQVHGVLTKGCVQQRPRWWRNRFRR